MVAWWYSKANKIWLRVLALVVSSVFFFTQVVAASVPDRNFWRERRKARQKLLASREKPHQSDSWSSEALLRVKKLEQKDVAGEVSSLITPQNLFTVPSQYGTVKEVHTQSSSNKRQEMGNRLIIHIQDAHSSPEAQLNSANILKYIRDGVSSESLTRGVSSESLTKNGETFVSHSKPLLICVEGSSGLVDTTLLSSFPEKKIKEEVASEFLKEGKITGEEYFTITGGEKAPVVNIYGVEDKRRYEKNLRAFEQGLSSGEKVRNYFQKVKKEINPLKARLYNKRLKDLESKIEAYQKKKISLSQYSQYLHRLSHGSVGTAQRPSPTKGNVGVARRGHPKDGTVNSAPDTSGSSFRVTESKYANFELFVEASKFEDKIDFSKVDFERSKYIKELSKKLTNDELSNLLIMSLDYRLGKVTSGEYYTYLQFLSSRMGKGVRSQDPRILTELVTSKEGKNEYPNLNLYIKYNKLYDRIDQNRLFSEISELEEELKLRLCEREEEKELVKLSRMLGVLQDLTSLKISNEDLAYYYKHRNEITPEMFSHFINAHNTPSSIPLLYGERVKVGEARRGLPNYGTAQRPSPTLVTANLSKFEEFYRIALKRNQALVDNTISRMEKQGVRVAVLIAGGFHTPGITKLLRDRNISYVVVTPRLGENYSSDTKLFPRKKRTDLEKAIAGIIGALRPASILGEQSFQTYSVIQLNGRTLILYSQFEPAQIERAFEQLRKNWESELGVRAELREAIENVDFLPAVLTRGKEAFALGVARRGERSLPFVLRYDVEQKKVSKIISGEKDCRDFILSGSFDNAREVGSDVFGKLSELWPFLVSKDIPIPGGADSKRAVSMKRTSAEVPRRTSAPRRGAFLNAAFGNIGEKLHRIRGGLNDLIRNLFRRRKDVSRRFEGDKSRSALRRRVFEFLDGLQYRNLTRSQRETLKKNKIRNEEEFNKKKSDLKRRLSIIFLDTGKNIFWVGGKYAAAHYGRRRRNVYVTAGFATRASPDQIFEVVTHDVLHILGFSHPQATLLGPSHKAQELMDRLALASAINKGQLDIYNAINESWDRKMAAGGVFHYDLSEVRRERVGRLKKMFNPKRAGKRPAQMDTSTSLYQRFNPDPDKFHYNKVGDVEIIAQGLNLGGVDTDIIINIRPFLRGHILITPERAKEHNQYFIPQVATVALEMLKRVNRRSYKLAYNSVGAFASINHLHLQALDYPEEKMPVEEEEKKLLFKNKGVSVWTLPNWLSRTLVLTSDNAQALQMQLLKLTLVLHELNQPFNIVFTYNDPCYSVYVFPRKFETSSEFGTGVAYLELAGEVLFVKQIEKTMEESLKIYEEATKADMAEEIRKVGISKRRFEDIVNRFKSSIKEENITFGNIPEALHRIIGGLNDLIGSLFRNKKDVSRRFTGDKSRFAIRKKVIEFLNSLEYGNLTRTQKEKLRESEIDEEEFNKKKNDLKKRLSIIYLDIGKNLFWVKRKYAAAHYGKRRRNVYVSAGYATRASPEQIFEVATHEALHILGFTHRQALNIARKYGIAFDAQKLMDTLAKEDKTLNGKKLILYSGPSAVGKSPLWTQVRRLYPDYFQRIVLYTSRGMRPGEQEGVDYYFRTAEEIHQLHKDNPESFITMDVHGNIQGVDLRDVERAAESGRIAIAEVSVDWAAKLRELYPDIVYTIFISPLSDEGIESRRRKQHQSVATIIYREIIKRQNERSKEIPTSKEKREKRAKDAVAEMARRGEYDAVIVNANVRDISTHQSRWEGPEGTDLVEQFMDLVRGAVLNISPQYWQEILELLERVDLTKGALAFDVDKTLLYKEEDIAKTAARLGRTKEKVEHEQVMRVVELFYYLLPVTRIVIISGNDAQKQWTRLLRHLADYLKQKNRLDLMERLTLYANGGATKVTHRVENATKVRTVSHRSYDQTFNFSEEYIVRIEDFINRIINSGELFRLYKQSIEDKTKQRLSEEQIRQSLQRAFEAEVANPKRKLRSLDYSWINGRNWQIDKQLSTQLTPERTCPWLELRGQEDLIVQITIKLLPSKIKLIVAGQEIEVNLGNDLRNMVIDQVEKEGILPDNFVLRPAGTGSIDIGASKDRAMEDFIISNPEVIRENVVYFGDEFSFRGNDTPILNVDGIKIISVGGPSKIEDTQKSRRVTVAGNVPDYTWAMLHRLANRYFRSSSDRTSRHYYPIMDANYIPGRAKQRKEDIGGWDYNHYVYGDVNVEKKEGKWQINDEWVNKWLRKKYLSINTQEYETAIDELFSNEEERGKLTTEELYGEIIKLREAYFRAAVKEYYKEVMAKVRENGEKIAKFFQADVSSKNDKEKVLSVLFADFRPDVQSKIFGQTSKPLTSEALNMWLGYGLPINDLEKFIKAINETRHYIHIVGNVNGLAADMKVFGEWLLQQWEKAEKEGKVTFIVKERRVGNEATYDDIMNLLATDAFQELKKFYDQKRFVVKISKTESPGINFNLIDENDELYSVLKEAQEGGAVLGVKGETNNFTTNLININHYRLFLSQDIETRRFTGVFWDDNENEAPTSIVLFVPVGIKVAEKSKAITAKQFYEARKKFEERKSNYEDIRTQINSSGLTFVELVYPEALLLPVTTEDLKEEYNEVDKSRFPAILDYAKYRRQQLLDERAKEVIGNKNFIAATYTYNEPCENRFTRENNRCGDETVDLDEDVRKTDIQEPGNEQVLVRGGIFGLDEWEFGVGKAADDNKDYTDKEKRTLISHQRVAEKEKLKPGVSFNLLYFFTPNLRRTYNEYRKDRPAEQIEEVNFYLGPYKPKDGEETIPLYNKGFIGVDKKGNLVFGRRRLLGGELKIRKDIVIGWEEEDVYNEENPPPEDANQIANKPVVVYTPLIARRDSENLYKTWDNGETIPVGHNRYNIIIINNKIHRIIKGDVLLPSIGIVISLDEEKFNETISSFLEPSSEKTDGEGRIVYEWKRGQSPDISFVLDWPEGRGIPKGYMGGGTLLVDNGKNLVETEAKEIDSFSVEGWFNLLSMQTQETQVQDWVRNPRMIIGITTSSKFFAVSFSGRSITTPYKGANFAEAIAIITKHIKEKLGENEEIKYAINLDGGSSVGFNLVDKDGKLYTINWPCIGPDNSEGIIRAISSYGFLKKKQKTNITFGNIGEELHRIVGGLNELIRNLFRNKRDVSRRFKGDKSRSALRRKVFEFLDGLEYSSLTRSQREALKKNKIRSEEEFNKKKSDLKEKLSIIYLDTGKNLFWVKGKYGASHYGRRKRNVYVSAGYATRASPDQIFEAVTHDVLHILGFSHRQALNIARQHNISYGAKELMDKLAKEDKILTKFAEITVEDINVDMFRDYDYRTRGYIPSPAIAFGLGLTLAKMALERAENFKLPSRTVLVTRDCRKMDPAILNAIELAFRYAGLNVVYTAENTPNAVSDYSWAVRKKYRLPDGRYQEPLVCIFNTASHVTGEKVWGAKVLMQDKDGILRSLTTPEIKEESLETLKKLVEKSELVNEIKAETFGQRITYDVRDGFVKMSTLVTRAATKRLKNGSVYDLANEFEKAEDVEEVLKKWNADRLKNQPLKGLKIVIEAAHTPSGVLARKVFEELGAEVIVLHEEIRALSGKHKADPSNDANLVDVKKRLVEEDADFALAFDLDGDRCAVIFRKSNGEMESLPPDVLMAVMLKFLVEEWGYSKKNLQKDGKKGLAVVRDVLGTEAVDKVADSLGIKTHQTDAGYVWLKEKVKQLKDKGYVVPMYGESSGHGWLHVTGEIENPITLVSLFGVMVKEYKSKHSKAKNLVEDTIKENIVVPYKRSGRFDPRFHQEFLSQLFKSDKLLQKEKEDISRGKIPQKVIALGKDHVIRHIQKDFPEGRSFKTQMGELKVDRLLTYSKDNIYRYADIRFSLNGEYIGRFIFRASANDPNFVCGFETPYEVNKKKEDVNPEFTAKKYDLVGGIVMDWLDRNNYSPISDDKIDFKNKTKVISSLDNYRKNLSQQNVIRNWFKQIREKDDNPPLSPLPVADFVKTRKVLEQILKDKKISLPKDVSSGELLSMLHFADQKGHVPIIALDQGTLVVWANPEANKTNPRQEDINAATLLRLTIVYYLAKGLREKGKLVGFLLDRPALEALNDKGAKEARVSYLIQNGLLPSDFREVVKYVPFVAQMEETRGKRGIIMGEGKIVSVHSAQRRDGFTVKQAMELGARMIKSNVFFYCGPKLTKYEEVFNERQWKFIEDLAKECRENNIGYVSELLFMVPVNKKAEEKEYKKTVEYMEAHAKATIEAAERMKQIKGITLQKLAHPYPGEAAMSEIPVPARKAALEELSEIVPGRWLILSAAEGWETFHKKVLEAAKYGQITGMLVGRSPIKEITQKKENKTGKTVDTIKSYEEVIKVLQEEAVEKELTLLGYIDNAPASVWQGLGLSENAVALMPALREELRIALEDTHTSPIDDTKPTDDIKAKDYAAAKPSDALIERYRLLVNKVSDRSKDADGVYNKVYLIVLTVLAAYLAEQKGEMTKELRNQFRKDLRAVLKSAEPEQISEALRNLRKINMPTDNPKKSIVNGLCRMVILADSKKGYTKVRLTTSAPSKDSLLSKYYKLATNVLSDKYNERRFSVRVVQLADFVLEAYFGDEKSGLKSELVRKPHTALQIQNLLIALEKAGKQDIIEAQKILTDEIYIKIETKEKDSIVDRLWEMLDLAYQGKDPTQALLLSKDFEKWEPVHRKVRRKVALDIISEEFSTNELEYLTEEMESPSFKGKVEDANRPTLYLQLRRLKCILDGIGARNRLPNRFPKKNRIGGLSMLKEALLLSGKPSDQKTTTQRRDERSRFKEKSGRSAYDALNVIALSPYLQAKIKENGYLTIPDYHKGYNEVKGLYPQVGLSELSEHPHPQTWQDFNKLVKQEYLTVIKGRGSLPNKYSLTEKGYDEIANLQREARDYGVREKKLIEGEIKNIERNKAGYKVIQNKAGRVWLFDPEGNPILKNKDAFWDYKFGETIFATRKAGGHLTLWNIKTGEAVKGFENIYAQSGFDIDEDETHLVTRVMGRYLTLWEIKTAKVVKGCEKLDAPSYELTKDHLKTWDSTGHLTIRDKNTGKVIPSENLVEKEEKTTQSKFTKKSAKGPSMRLWSLLFGGLGILLFMNSDVIASVGEYIRSGHGDGWGIIFALLIPVGILGGLIFAINRGASAPIAVNNEFGGQIFENISRDATNYLGQLKANFGKVFSAIEKRISRMQGGAKQMEDKKGETENVAEIAELIIDSVLSRSEPDRRKARQELIAKGHTSEACDVVREVMEELGKGKPGKKALNRKEAVGIVLRRLKKVTRGSSEWLTLRTTADVLSRASRRTQGFTRKDTLLAIVMMTVTIGIVREAIYNLIAGPTQAVQGKEAMLVGFGLSEMKHIYFVITGLVLFSPFLYLLVKVAGHRLKDGEEKTLTKTFKNLPKIVKVIMFAAMTSVIIYAFLKIFVPGLLQHVGQYSPLVLPSFRLLLIGFSALFNHIVFKKVIKPFLSKGQKKQSRQKSPRRNTRNLLTVLSGAGVAGLLFLSGCAQEPHIISSINQFAEQEIRTGFGGAVLAGLSLGGVILAGIGGLAIYHLASIGRTGLRKVEQFRFSEALGLRNVWHVLKPLLERGRGLAAAILRQEEKRAELRMSWAGPRKELPEEEAVRIRELAEELRGVVPQLWAREGRYWGNPEINRWLAWTSLPEEMAGEVRGIEEFARSVRRKYESVVVIGEEVGLYAEVGLALGRERIGYPEIYVLESTHPKAIEEIESKIDLKKTLFVVSSPEQAYRHFYRELTEFYVSQGISAEEIASQVGKHFVAIVEDNTPFAEEAREKEFLKTFNAPEGISGPYSIFSYEGLVPLALAGVNIKGFVESGRRGMEMSRKENPEENLAMKLAAFQEAMRRRGRNQIVLVLPEELKGFGQWWQELTLPLERKGEGIIPIVEEKLSSPESYGEKTAFIRLRVGADRESSAIRELKEAGYPVLEISLGGKEAIGQLFYVAEFATALTAYLGVSSESLTKRSETFVSHSKVEGVSSESLTRKGEPLSEYPVKPEVVKYKGTKVFVFDFESLFDIEPVKEATPSRMGIELKVRPRSRAVFKVMEKIVEAAEEVRNLDGVKFAFVSSRRDVSREVMEQMLRDFMSRYGLSTEVVASVIDNNFIIDRRRLEENGGIVGISRTPKISTKAVFSIINESLLLTGRTDGNGTEIKIITDRESRWAKNGTRKMMERILWVVLSPAEEGEVLSTAAGLVVAIEGKVSKWLREFIKGRYSKEKAERLLSLIQRGNTIILPATPVDEKYLEKIRSQEMVYKIQA